MKKILNLSLFLFVFCLTSLFGGLIFTPNVASAADTSAEPIEISSATELKRYIDNYGAGIDQYGQPNDYVVLTADIDMSVLNTTGNPNGDVVYNTIGTEETPFAGVFDGRGYTISNLRIDVSVDIAEEGTQNNQYAGLFGVTNGATIKNVSISQNITITTGGCITSYVGALVGKAQNTSIQYAQITAKINYNTNFDCNVNFGTLAGMAVDSDIENVVCRYNGNTGFGNWTFDRKDGKVLKIGGVVGTFSNSELSFAVVSVKYFATIAPEFIGDLSIGGIAGNVSQGGSKIINVATENNFNILNNASTSIDAVVNVGEVAGVISNPAPISKNISYIHFKSNSGIERFGSIGNYAYADSSVYDYITIANETMSSAGYFENQLWHPLYGDWDFDTVWYVGSSMINLQSFYGNFTVRVSNNLNTDILNMTSTLGNNYRFGDQVAISFDFKDILEGDVVTGDMSNYYSLSSVILNGVEKAKIVTLVNGDNVTYRISGTDQLDISKNQNDNGFTLYVKNVNMSTAGEYNISTTAKDFEANVTSRLYRGDNDDQLVDGETPGYVFYAEGTNTETESLSLSRMVYGQTYRIETKAKPNTPNAFVGWYLASEDGEDVLLSGTQTQSRILEFTFGSGYFTSDCEIYAKYRDNACVITFNINEGILKIDLYSGGVSVTTAGQTESVSKDESSLKLEIYVKKDYDFNAEQFIVDLDVYKTDDPTKSFCTLRESYENDEYKYYHFVLDMTSLTDDFENSFTISCEATKTNNGDMTWIWIVAGSVGGVVVLGLLILMIVLLARRNRFGGGSSGSGGSSFKKKNYKNMYF